MRVRIALGILAIGWALLLATSASALNGRLLRVTATSYACRVCTGSDGRTLLRRGMIAVSRDLAWLWGQRVRVNDRAFIVRDRMPDYWSNRIDIYTPSLAEARAWGIRTVTLEVNQ